MAPTLRPTTPSDLPFVLAAEGVARAGGFVAGWPEEEHRAALAAPGVAHLLVEEDGAPLGFVILRGVGTHSIELKRIVIVEPGRGLGRAALRAVKRHVFDAPGAHRLWLDVFPHNTRARALYASEGFVEEGVLRDAVRTDGGFASLVVMSLLRPEYAAGNEDGRRPD